jgi:hypothetical protein
MPQNIFKLEIMKKLLKNAKFWKIIIFQTVVLHLFGYVLDFLACELFRRSCRPFDWAPDRFLLLLASFFVIHLLIFTFSDRMRKKFHSKSYYKMFSKD